MQFTKYCLLIIVAFVFNIKTSVAQTDMLFWFVAPEINDYHWPGNPLVNRGQPTWLRFSNAEDFAITVTISQPATGAFTPITVNIPANETRSVQFIRGGGAGIYDLNDIENYINSFATTAPDPGNKGFKGLKIESTGRMTCYYEMAGPYNMELMSLKGRNALGTDFYVPFQTRYDPPAYNATYPMIYSAIDIVATENNTTVTIEPTDDIMLNLAAQTQHSGNYTIILNEGETFTVVPYGIGNNTPWRIDRNKDLAGTRVTANKPIAVSTKDDLVADGTGAVDMVADQLVPVNLLGMKYVIMEGRVINNNGVNSFDNIYVIPIHDNTDIDVDDNGTVDYTIPTAGTQLRIPINNANTIIAASDTILVYHVTGINPSLIPGGSASNYNQLGGAIIPTIDVCTGSYSVSFVRSYTSDFIINVMVRDGGQSGFEIKSGADPWDNTLLTAADFVEVVPGEWWCATKAFNTGDVHVNDVTTIRNVNNNLFHLGIMHGSVDCFYGYFSDFNAINVVGNVGTTINVDHFACYGERVELVAYGANSYYWYANVTPDFLNGQENDQRPVIYPTGNRKYTVVGYGDCNLKDSTEINVYVANPIVSDFVLEAPGWPPCSPLDLTIYNFSEGVDNKYKWWYGDGTGDTITLPGVVQDTIIHQYINNSDTMQVRKLTLITENTFYCRDTMETDIIVYPAINANFVPDVIVGCNPLNVNFTDLSSGNLDKYNWVYGDGMLENTIGNESHTYSHTNTTDTVAYNMELRLTSPFLCRDTARTTIRVYPYIEGEFTLDKAEGCSPLDVRITNNSVGETSINLDYGDGSAHLVAASFLSSTHTYVNNGDTVAHFPIALIAENDAGCIKYWYDTITVYPRVEASFVVDTGRVCNTGPIEFTRTSADGPEIASEFYWDFGDGTNSDTTALVFEKIYANLSNSNKTYNVELIAESQYGCADTASRTVMAYRSRANYVLDTDEGCSPLDINITNTSKGNLAEVNYHWVFNNGDADEFVDQPANPRTYTNVGADTAWYNLSLTVESIDGLCVTNKTEDIIVYPQISVSIDAPIDPTVCDSTTVNFTSSIVNPALTGVTYNWDFGDASSSNQVNPSHLYRNLNNASAVVRNVRLDVETREGCTNFDETTVTVLPYVNALFTLDTINGCSPLSVDAIATQYPGIPAGNYSWDFGDGFGTHIGYNPLQYTYPDAPPGPNMPYTIRLDVSDQTGTCTDFMEREVTVFAASFADFTTSDGIFEGCDTFEVQFVNNSLNAATYLWDFKDGTSSIATNPPPIRFKNSTDLTKDYHVELTATTADGCVDDTIQTISVYPYVKADFAVDIVSGCSPLNITITNNSRGGTYRWYWNSQNLAGPADYTSAVGNEVIPHTYTNVTGTNDTLYLSVIAQNANGCTDTLTREIVVYSSINAQFTYNQPDACNKSAVEFTNTSTGGNSYTLNWDFGDGTSTSTTLATVNKTFTNYLTNDQNFTVTMYAESENGCTDQFSDVVTVYSRLIAGISVPASQACPDFTTTIINTSIGNNANQYNWYVDGVNEHSSVGKDNFTYTYTNADTVIQTYTVRLEAINPHGCTDDTTTTITVYELVDAQFTMDIASFCSPDTVQFTNTSFANINTNFDWSFGDATSSGVFEPSHRFVNSSRTTDRDFTILLTATSENFCTDTISHQVTAYHQPLAKINVLSETAGCPAPDELSVTMQSESIGYDSFEWRFGDPANTTNTVDNIVTFGYPNLTVNDIKIYKPGLYVETVNGCSHIDTSITLSVFPRVNADFTMDIDEGCSPLSVEFQNASTEPATQFYWVFNDGSTGNKDTLIHTFVNDTYVDKVYNVMLVATSDYNCTDNVTKPITVNAQPKAIFNPSPSVQTFPEARVWMQSGSNNQPWDYLWEFGDIDGTTSTSSNLEYFDYQHWGYKYITLTLNSTTSNCSATRKDTVLINPPDVNADFDANVYEGCEPLLVEFTAALSPYYPAENYSYEWDFGDGSATVTGETPVHGFEKGTYSVKLTAYSNEPGGGQDVRYKKIRVYAKPVANFDAIPRESMLNQNLQARVEFYNLSECNDTSGCAWLWDFGDGNQSIQENVVHNYTEVGEYDVQLTVTTANGCDTTITKNNYIEIIGEGDIEFPNAFTPHNDDGLNDIFRPVHKGVIEYELLIYNRWGELIYQTEDISEGWDGTVKGEPAKPDVYVWKASGKFTNGRSFEIAGDVTLIR